MIHLKLKNRMLVILMLFITIKIITISDIKAASLRAGVGKIDITCEDQAVLNKYSLNPNPLYVKALVLDNGSMKAVIIAYDIIWIQAEFLSEVRERIQKELKINGSNVLMNASHNHYLLDQICKDVVDKTIQAVKIALRNMVPVKIGTGIGYEDELTMSHTLKLKNGKDWSIRFANPCPPESDVAGVGPIDPEIGILRIDKADGKTLAVLYNFACHPTIDRGAYYRHIDMYGRISADFPGYTSKAIEENLGNSAVAIFLQGCGGDVYANRYKIINEPQTSEKVGKLLGLTILKAVRSIQTGKDADLKVFTEKIELPRRADFLEKISTLETEQAELLSSLRFTSLNFKTFLPLYIKYSLNPDFPSYYSHRYMKEKILGIHELVNMDAENKIHIQKYLKNIYAMEKLARIQENIILLKERQKENESAGPTVSVEIQGMRIGNYILITFPGEAFVEVGLDIKKKSPYEHTYIAAYSNGYIGYAPTADAYKGGGYGATNNILAPEWQEIYEKKVLEIINKL